MFDSGDIIAMTLRYLLSSAVSKDLHPQFGATSSQFSKYVLLGMRAIVTCLSDNQISRVYWDLSPAALKKAVDRTKQFLDIPGIVAMVDGNKLRSYRSAEAELQNRDYNGWTHDTNRNILLVWDPWGKIVDAYVNYPGTFHDSKMAIWGGFYDHVVKFPDGYRCCCDSAFTTSGFLEDKLVKTKEEYREGEVRSTYDMSLTHLRQCSEWGNNLLTGTFCHLKLQLPTDNDTRALLLWSCILLNNFRTETVNRNQIRT